MGKYFNKEEIVIREQMFTLGESAEEEFYCD
jgi:hypothetical protein